MICYRLNLSTPSLHQISILTAEAPWNVRSIQTEINGPQNNMISIL